MNPNIANHYPQKIQEVNSIHHYVRQIATILGKISVNFLEYSKYLIMYFTLFDSFFPKKDSTHNKTL